jgi:putative ABC transport system permease protein
MIQQQFQDLGTNLVVVFSGNRTTGAVRRGAKSAITLTVDDVDAIAAECPSAKAASPRIWASAQVIAGNQNWSPSEILGVNASYLTLSNWQMERGEFFTSNDVRTAAKVCVLGKTVAKNLFQASDCVGTTIRIRSIPFTVLGVLNARGANLFGQDEDDIVLIPNTTVMRRVYGQPFKNVWSIAALARSVDRIPELKEEIKELMRQRHRIRTGEPDDFDVFDATGVVRVLGFITFGMTLVLGSVAGVSLVVGGIGIMNIMLVSVTERTREIGIRLAVGARSRDILRQFLLEAVVLSLTGGLIGVALGILAAVGATSAVNAFLGHLHWPMTISVTAILVSLVFAASVGVFFGYYPARKASRLDPIESLRYE